MKSYYLETYGCQMNVSDSELIAGILLKEGFHPTEEPNGADIILLNTCAIRERAEDKIHSRLGELKILKKEKPELLLGILGCMSQHVKDELLENKPYVDFVLGPDSYKRIPELLQRQNHLQTSLVDTTLSRFEVYEDLFPHRQSGVNAWVSIMRGCDKFCTFCIVPFTRGRERSRSVQDIVTEIKNAVTEGFVEFTLLGQNVNSYHFEDYRFYNLLDTVAGIEGVKRIRFISPHPKDMNDDLFFMMRDHSNICNSIHLPLQAGSTSVLKRMNRTYSQDEYFRLVDRIREILPSSSLSTDIIVGFPGETDDDFKETLKVMEKVKFDTAFTFKYSSRPGTKAAEFSDQISEIVKQDRLNQIIDLQREHSQLRNQEDLGKIMEVLVEKESKKDERFLTGRTDTNKWVVFPKEDLTVGDFVQVKITGVRGIALVGEIIRQEEPKIYALI